MKIKNPRRILVIGAPDSGVLSFLKDLTGSAPDPIDDSTAGLSHSWTLETSYYKAELPIWIDEITDTNAWRAEFVKEEAKEVVQVLGAWVYCFRKPTGEGYMDTIKATLRAVSDVVEKGVGYEWDGVCLAVAMPQGTTPHLYRSLEEWENLCREFGFEYVDSEAKGRNEYGEPVGMARIKEALEANDWTGSENVDLNILDELDEDEEESFRNSLALEEAEMGMELLGMKSAVSSGEALTNALGEDEEDESLQVEELERMMHKMQTIRQNGAELPETQRRILAAEVVNDLMKSLG